LYFDGLVVRPHPPHLLPDAADPADAITAKETRRLAFAVALEALPPRQRAILILRDVLCWTAPEVADLLGTTPASVNSALQRARATLAGRTSAPSARGHADAGQRALLVRYATAFEDKDMAALIALLRHEATKGPTGTRVALGGAAAG
jgi:RNA polymerase sigma-70 factor (ECF subfamily)